MKNYEITYTVSFKTVIAVPDNSTIHDEVNNIEIPEGPGGQYVKNSFDVELVVETDEEPTNH